MGARHFNIPLLRRRRALGTLGVRVSLGVGAATWTGYAPSVSGVAWSVSLGYGAATWTGYDPAVGVAVTAAPGVGAATWTGYAPTVTGLQADGQIIDRFGNELIARNGDFIVNLPQAA